MSEIFLLVSVYGELSVHTAVTLSKLNLIKVGQYHFIFFRF